MRLFDELSTSYATQENAIKAANKKLGDKTLDDYRWMMVVTAEGRFQVCIQARNSEDFYLVHRGLCIVG